MNPTAPKSSVTQSCVPSGRFTLLTCTDRRLKPPHPLNRVSSDVAWPLGVRPLKADPVSGSRSTPPVWQPGGVGGGGSVTVSVNVPVAVAPFASVTVTEKLDVPFVVGAPSTSPDGRRVRPAGMLPDHVYGARPPLARKLVEKKLPTNTLRPEPRSQTPFAHVKNRLSIASGGSWPVPVPAIGTVCGLAAALSVRMNVAERSPEAVGEKSIATLQLVPGARVRPEHWSSTWVKSSGLAPRVAALLMNSAPVPELVIVIDCAALVVPIAWAVNVSDVGENVTAGVPVGGGGGGLPPPPPPPWEPTATAGTTSTATAASATDARRTRRFRAIVLPPCSACESHADRLVDPATPGATADPAGHRPGPRF